MKDIRDTYENAKKKSRKAIRVEYDGKIYRIDPVKLAAKLGSFALTASLVITAVAYGAPKIKNIVVNKNPDINNNMEEQKYAKDLEESLNHYEKTIIDCISIPVDPVTKSYDYDTFYNNLAHDCKNDIIHLDAYIRRYGLESKEINNILLKITGSDKVVYTNIYDYLKSKGFETYEDFRTACLNYYDQKFFSNFTTQIESQEENETDYTNIDNNIIWVKAILESENPNLELYKAYQQFGDSDEMNEIVGRISFTESQNYSNLNEYIIAKGFNSMEEWQTYCVSQLSKSNEERGMSL